MVGAAATAILALAAHAITGDRFISGLEQQAETELAARGLDGASVTFGRDPLSRSAVLDGELAQDARQEAVGVVRAIPGVSGASWKREDRTETPGGSRTAAPGASDADKVAACQGEVDRIIEARKISFRSGSAYVSPASNEILDALAAALKKCDGLTVAVQGHTDDDGDRAVNQVMSQERADRIKAGLIDRGLSEKLITATGYGSTRPRVEGSDAAADAQNRRIEFQIGPAQSTSQNGANGQQGE